MFIVGHILQGFCTSLLLIAALPPIVTAFPVAKLRITLVVVNLCIFGAVALGPVAGGLQAAAGGWRPLFWIGVALAVTAVALTLLTFEDVPPADPTAPRDLRAVALAAAGCIPAFFGAAELTTRTLRDPVVIGPLLGGLALIVVLIVNQYRSHAPLLTVRTLATTLPVTGIVVAMCAAAASVSAVALTGVVLAQRYGPLHVGLLFLPEFGAAVMAAIIFGAVFRTRLFHSYVLVGLLLLSAGIYVIGRAE